MIKKKPEARIIGADSNIFCTLGIAAAALRDAGMYKEATEMSERARSSHGYEAALSIIVEYINPIHVNDSEQRDSEDDDEEEDENEINFNEEEEE
jgi:hypothetical protein